VFCDQGCAMVRVIAASLLCFAASLRENFEGLDDLHQTLDTQVASDESEETDFWVTCPKGTTERKFENSHPQCQLNNLDLFVPDEPQLGDGVFDFHSDSPIMFNRQSTAINITLAFADEFYDALGDNDTFYAILNDFSLAELNVNESLRREFEEWIENISQTDFNDGQSDFWAGVHGTEAGLLPAVFAIEKGLEHWILAEAIVLLHALEYAAAHGAVFGEAFLARYLGISLAGFAHAAEHYLHIFLHYILTPYLVVEAWQILKEFHAFWVEEYDSSEDFVMRLVLRGDCAIQRTSLTIHNLDADEINPLVEQVCGRNQTTRLSKLMIRTHKVMEAFFQTVAAFGRCMNPGINRNETGDRRAKVLCAQRVYRPLRQNRNLPGQLWSALTYVAEIMKATDDLLTTPHYGNIMEEKFGTPVPRINGTRGFSELADVARVQNESVSQRFLVCYSILATHRAFELSMSRVEQSMRVWAQTFGRRKTAANIFGISWKPCQKVFTKFGSNQAELRSFTPIGSSPVSVSGSVTRSSELRTDFCKMNKLQWGQERQNAENLPCSSPMNMPQWRCHERTRFQDALWCKNAGVFQSFEYSDFGDDSKSPCGCECCKRENVGSSLWPAGGGHR